MNEAEIMPPWIAFPGQPPRTFFWREAGEPWLCHVWQPFWNGLDAHQRAAYLAKFPPSQEWIDLFFDESWDAELSEIDRQDAEYLATERERRAQHGQRLGWFRRLRARLKIK